MGQLEALYLDVADARGAVLICHPNPVQGGTMLNKVVSTLQRTARDAGYVTLRFNYRGVGQSAGSHDMGAGEVADAEAAAAWLRAQHPGLPLVLMGFVWRLRRHQPGRAPGGSRRGAAAAVHDRPGGNAPDRRLPAAAALPDRRGAA